MSRAGSLGKYLFCGVFMNRAGSEKANQVSVALPPFLGEDLEMYPVNKMFFFQCSLWSLLIPVKCAHYFLLTSLCAFYQP